LSPADGAPGRQDADREPDIDPEGPERQPLAEKPTDRLAPIDPSDPELPDDEDTPTPPADDRNASDRAEPAGPGVTLDVRRETAAASLGRADAGGANDAGPDLLRDARGPRDQPDHPEPQHDHDQAIDPPSVPVADEDRVGLPDKVVEVEDLREDQRLGPDVAALFEGSEYSLVTVQEPITVYRVHGGNSQEIGRWWSRDLSPTSQEAVEELAIKPEWNSAEQWVEAQLPAGTTFYEGRAASQGDLEGGGDQIYLPDASMVQERIVARACYMRDR